MRDSQPAGLGTTHPLLRKLSYALAASDLEGDRTQARIARRLQFTMSLVSVPVIGSLATGLLLGGHGTAAAFTYAYVGATLALIVGLAITGRFGMFRVPHTLLVGVLPFALHIELGGFAASGGMILWVMLLPVTATMFGFRYPWAYFAGAVGAMLVGAFAYRPGAAELSGQEINASFAINTVGLLLFLSMSVRHFVMRIDEEKARADQLLYQVLPAPIVRRLKRGQVVADQIDAVSVVFADIVGFTPLAARVSPGELLALLDEIFTRFDELARANGAEKIKTIGDAYMAVAGAPERCHDHADRAARLALAMRDHVMTLARSRRIDIAMRIGIHTGPVVAGVIGIERVAYDLWGDTVNTASRMESHGAPNEIQVTEATRHALAGRFALRERGPIEVKGRGTLTTYWLDAAVTAPAATPTAGRGT